MKKVTVYGCGWLGEPLCDHIHELGYAVTATTRSSTSTQNLLEKPYKVLQSDITSLFSSDTRLFDADIFIVAITHKNTRDFEALVKKLKEHDVQKVIYVSSTSVYANNNSFVNEIDGPMNLASAIYQVEAVFRKALPNTTFIRFSGLIGPKRHPGRFFQRAGKSIAQPEAPVNFIHLKDCIGLISEVIQQEAWGKTFNGCGPHHPIKREFYTWATRDAGYAIPEMGKEDALSYKKVDGSLVTEILGYDYQVKDFYQSNIYRTLE